MKYYVVLKGRTTGIFTDRNDCKRQVDGFVGAQYKSFTTEQSAQFARKEKTFGQKGQSSIDYLRQVMGVDFDRAICTDAACPSNPGPVEYRGVVIATGKELFYCGPYGGGSVNIAEFLAIVSGLQRLLSHPHYSILYTDSTIALGWIKKGTIKTTIQRNNTNALLFDQIDKAVIRLAQHADWSSSISLKKRPTQQWGQIPADFGRK